MNAAMVERREHAHREWRESVNAVFVRRWMELNDADEFRGNINAIGDNEILRMLDNIGWGSK